LYDAPTLYARFVAKPPASFEKPYRPPNLKPP
jgi:hypothetical protein